MRRGCDFDMTFPDDGTLNYVMVCRVCGHKVSTMKEASYLMRRDIYRGKLFRYGQLPWWRRLFTARPVMQEEVPTLRNWS